MLIVFVTGNGWWSLFLLITKGFLVSVSLSGGEEVMMICVCMGWWSLGCMVIFMNVGCYVHGGMNVCSTTIIIKRE